MVEGRLLPCRTGLRVDAAHLRPCGSRAEFLDRFAARVRALRVGDPLLPETEVGPLIHPREADRVAAWIEEAVAAGAKLIGGGRVDSTTLIPSVLVNPPRDAKVSTRRSVRPDDLRLPLHASSTMRSHAANSLPVAFQASIFAEDLRTALRCGRAPRRLGRDGQRPYGLPHRLDAFRRPPPVRLRHRRHSLDDARDDPGEDDRVQDVGSGRSPRSQREMAQAIVNGAHHVRRRQGKLAGEARGHHHHIVADDRRASRPDASANFPTRSFESYCCSRLAKLSKANLTCGPECDLRKRWRLSREGREIWQALDRLTRFASSRVILNHKQPDHPAMDQIPLGDHI